MSGGGGELGRRRQVAAGELLRAPLGGAAHPDGDLADLLVLEQPPHQLRARILPAVLLRAARQQHLRLEAHQPAGHVEVVGGLVEAELVDGLEELVGDPRDRNVGDLELLFAQQVQQQIERAGERVELDDEAGPRAERGGRAASGGAS